MIYELLHMKPVSHPRLTVVSDVGNAFLFVLVVLKLLLRFGASDSRKPGLMGTRGAG